jgi:hypothetical protein
MYKVDNTHRAGGNKWPQQVGPLASADWLSSKTHKANTIKHMN